jgi:RND family efflux transporter MFP subunit
VLPVLLLAGCGDDSKSGAPGQGRPGGGGRPTGGSGGPPWGRGAPGGAAAAVPVEVATVERRDISSYIETNGILEAENEVDLVARTAGPIVELLAEEGMRVRKDQLLARLEQDEILAELEISRVNLDEATLSFERAKKLQSENLISAEEFDQAKAAYDSAQAQFDGNRIQLGYTEIRAPFAGLIINRYIDFAQHVSASTPLFRLSDFTPLLCPIQVPERELSKLALGQSAHLTVESFGDQRFEARVLRLSPVVDAATGTIKVTLEVDARGKLRPGMFARVFLETETHEDTLVIPKTALSLESIGDTVYVANEGAAARREVELGFREGDFVEVLSGVQVGETVVVVGHDGLSEGTPLQVLRRDGESVQAPAQMASRSGGPAGAPGGATPAAAGAPQPAGPGPEGRPRLDLAKMTPEQIEALKERMRARGMTEEQIEQRLERMRQRSPEQDGSSNR